jgi:hypothetical protein
MYFHDSSAAFYKNTYTYTLINIYHEQNCDLCAEWHSSTARCRNGQADWIGETVKRLAAKTNLHSVYNNQIQYLMVQRRNIFSYRRNLKNELNCSCSTRNTRLSLFQDTELQDNNYSYICLCVCMYIYKTMAVFWVVAPCRLVWVYQRFRGLYCLHHHGYIYAFSLLFSGTERRKLEYSFIISFPVHKSCHNRIQAVWQNFYQ